jgi:hypothetical protein
VDAGLFAFCSLPEQNVAERCVVLGVTRLGTCRFVGTFAFLNAVEPFAFPVPPFRSGAFSLVPSVNVRCGRHVRALAATALFV